MHEQKPDNGTTTSQLVIAYGIWKNATEKGEPISDEKAFVLARKEATLRQEAAIDTAVDRLNSSPDALAAIEAVRSVGPLNEELELADRRVEYMNAGYSKGQALELARQKLSAIRVARLTEMKRVASLIKLRMTGATITATNSEATTPATDALPMQPTKYERIDKTHKRATAPQRVEVPFGWTRDEIVMAAKAGVAPIVRPSPAPNPVTKNAEARIAKAKAAGKVLLRETAFAEAFSEVYGNEKGGEGNVRNG